MKVLIDTNVLLDYFLTRGAYCENASKILSYCLFSVEGCIAAHSFVDLFYQIYERSKLSLDYCRNTIIKLCQTFEVCSVDKQRILEAARNLEFTDFEDSLQNECASYSDVDYIITRNSADFKNATVPLLTPQEFVRLMEGQ